MGCLGLVEVIDHGRKKSGWMFWLVVGAAAVVIVCLVGFVKHPVELVAQFIRRADYVFANGVLRDEGRQLGYTRGYHLRLDG